MPDTVLLARLQKEVDFLIKTTGGSGGNGPRFICWHSLPNGNFELKLQGTPGKGYMIEVSEDLAGWADSVALPASLDGVITHEMSLGTYGSPAFFRARPL